MPKSLKRVTIGQQARQDLVKGMSVVYEAVSSTLGPRSRTVAIDIAPDQDMPPVILRDGVSVARAINLSEPNQDMGARLLKAAANKTVSDVGDGTTLTTILAYSLVKEAMQAVANGANPMVIKQQLEAIASLAVAMLMGYAKKITNDKEAQNIAAISASSADLGTIVFEALNKVGVDGIVTVEQGSTSETTTEFKQGLELDRGYSSRNFLLGNKDEVTIEDPFILITDKKLSHHTDIIPIFDLVGKQGHSKNLVVIAGDIQEEALATMVINHIQGNINTVAIQAPGFGQTRLDYLEDIATITGGIVVYQDAGRTIESVKLTELGRCGKFTARRDRSIVVDGKGNEISLVKRQDEIRDQVKNARNLYEEEIHRQRLGRVTGGVAVINVGGSTEVEVTEKKERVIDAIAATKAALSDGVVAGGEVTFYHMASYLPNENFGDRILVRALRAPLKKLLENSGLDYTEVAPELKKYPLGVDVTTGTVKDLLKAGIIDPVKVLKTALENAVSVACLALTTDTLVTWEVPDENN